LGTFRTTLNVQLHVLYISYLGPYIYKPIVINNEIKSHSIDIAKLPRKLSEKYNCKKQKHMTRI